MSKLSLPAVCAECFTSVEHRRLRIRFCARYSLSPVTAMRKQARLFDCGRQDALLLDLEYFGCCSAIARARQRGTRGF